MEAVRESVWQTALLAGISPGSAKKLIYLLGLAKDGRTLQEAADALHLKPGTVESWCKRADITLKDFDPFPKERYPVRPKPTLVLNLTKVSDGGPLFGKREQRGHCGRTHPNRSQVAGRTYCVDCGKELKVKPEKKEKAK